MVIALMGILVSIVAAFIVRPVEGYRDLARRAALVEAAESALQRMRRDIRTALPNSVRVTNTASGYALELIPVLDAARYDRGGDNAECELGFGGGEDNEFDVEHLFRNPATLTTAGIRMVVNNTGVSGVNNVYDNAGLAVGLRSLITPVGLTISITPSGAPCPTGAHHVNFTPDHRFQGQSPNQRLYVVTTALSYLCDTTVGTLTRYYNYAITATQPVTAADFVALNASSALAANRVTACNVASTTVDVRNRALVTLMLTLAESDEQIRLIHQAQVDNTR